MSILPLLLLASLLSQGERRSFEGAIASHLSSDLQAAVRGYGEILDAHPEFVPARLYRAEALWSLGKTDAAREDLSLARGKAEALLLCQLLEGTFRGEASGPSSGLVAKLRARYPLEANRFLATGTPALVLLSLGEIEAAAADYRLAADLDPDDATLHQKLSAAFIQAKAWPAAVDALERLLKLRPDDASAWRQLGSANLVLLRWDPAISAFERAIRLSGEDPSLLLALGYARERKPEIDAALDLYRRAARLAPGSAAPHYRIGRALMTLGKTSEAEEELEKARDLDPSFPAPLSFLGELELKRGRVDLAIETLERAVALDPEFYEAYYQLAQAYRRAGRDEDARTAIARYSELKTRLRDVPSQEEVLTRGRERPKSK
jgi:tetratricopeptide (TPR) repeat protein